jgi:hypothetical protein
MILYCELGWAVLGWLSLDCFWHCYQFHLKLPKEKEKTVKHLCTYFAFKKKDI